MKKTIIALLALGGCALGATETFSTATKTATIALTFNVDAIEDISGINFAGVTETPNFFMFTGTWGSGESGSLGLANNGSSGTDTTGVYSSWVKGSNLSGKATDCGLGSVFTSSTNWDNIGIISLVYSYSTPTSGATTTNVALSIGYTDGTVTTFGDTKSNIVFNGSSGFAATGVTIDDTYVASYEVDTTFTSLADAKLKSAALAVPEPTTATLSLLALAGLAARRRRK